MCIRDRTKIFAAVDACVEPVLYVTEALLESKNARDRDSVINVLSATDADQPDSRKYREKEIWIYGNPIKVR